MFIPYNIYSWVPPKLTPEQEIQIGKEIAQEGREKFLRRYHPYLSKKEQERITDAEDWTTTQRIRVIVIGVLFLGAIIFFAAPVFVIALPAIVIVLAVSLGSMYFARSRYRRWVDEMIAKYAAHVATLPPDAPV